jgi:hypothetical protein
LEDPEIREFAINLKNHGFLIGAESLGQLARIINDIQEKHQIKMR